MIKKIVSIVIIILLSFLIFGCGKNTNKLFANDDFEIILPDRFESMNTNKYDYLYKNKDVIITVLREDINALKKYKINNDSTTEDYLKVISELSNKEYEIINKEKYSYMIYESSEHYHMATTFKSNDYFWIINYMCLKKNIDIYKNEFFKWNDSIVI